MASGDINPYARKKLSGRLLELLEETRKAWVPRIVESNRPAHMATSYLPFDLKDKELVQEVERIFDKVSPDTLLNLLSYIILEIASWLRRHIFSRGFYSWRNI